MSSIDLNWTPSESDITEIASYTIQRSIDSGAFTDLINCKVIRDFLGGIIGVENCVTTPSVPDDDTGEVVDKVQVEDALITYTDNDVEAGHTYCYRVIAYPMGNNQSVGQGPPSGPSNIQCITISDVTCDLNLTVGSASGSPDSTHQGFSQGWPSPAQLTGSGGPLNELPTTFANIDGQFQMTVSDLAPQFRDLDFTDLGIVLLRVDATVIDGVSTVTYQWPTVVAGLVFGTRYCIQVGGES